MNKIAQKQNIQQPHLSDKKAKDVPVPIFDSQIDIMIKKQLDANFRYSEHQQDSRMKSKSVASLHSKNTTQPKYYLDRVEQRFQRKNTQILSAISEVQKECQNFGGVQYIQKEMIKHKISKKEQFDYYHQRVKQFNKNFSLPKLLSTNLDNRKSGSSLIRSISQKNAIKNYNKWYISPAQRFKNPQVENKAESVTKYVQKIMKKHNKNVSLKSKYAPTLISQSVSRLGRKPVISIYAQIKQG